jgi:hypothetical protein
LADRLKQYAQVQEKNKEFFDELQIGEEGVDYIRTADSNSKGSADPRMPNVKVFERELKAQVNLLKL